VVADYYYKLMTQTLGVKINLNKSLISKHGVFEFAKRLVHPEFGIISAVPLKEFSLVSQNISVLATLFRRFRTEPRISTVFRVFGFGYKVLGNLTKTINLKSRAGFLLNWALMPGITVNSSKDWANWFQRTSIRPTTLDVETISRYTLIESLCYLIVKGYYANFKQIRFNTAFIFNFDLALNPKYTKLFDNDDFVNRCDFALHTIYEGVMARALEDRKYFDALMFKGIPINELGINTLVDIILDMPTKSTVLSEEVETPLGSVLKLDPLIQRIVINSLIKVKLRPEVFAKLLETLE
jgi:hypothetical protein